jgi:hypothetical protein
MPITYSGSLATDQEKVRFYIGDTVDSAGPKPSDGNFTDAELNALISLEGSWQRAVAACFEALASLWAKQVNFSADGVSASNSDVAKQYQASALEWRKKHGGSGGTGSRSVTRQDGYSDDLDSVTT